MKNLCFVIGCFLFFFSYCQTPQITRSAAEVDLSTAIQNQVCELKTSEVAGYLDFVRCFPRQGYCAHFLVPEYEEQSRGLTLGTSVILSGNFSLEGASIGNKYYYLVDDLSCTRP